MTKEQYTQRILDNIQNDAMLYVRTGKKLPYRDPQWNGQVQIAIEIETKLYNDELWAELIQDELELAHISGVSHEVWLKKCGMLYIICPVTFSVTSLARGPKHKRVTECESEYDARKRILKLVKFKYYDHYMRGFDFMWNPLEEKEAA